MKKGQMLIIVILIMSVFFSIVLVLSSLMLNDQINQRRIGDSMSAYYAAETGLEQGILRLKDNLPAVPANFSGTVNLDKYEVYYEADTGTVKIQSVGISRNSRRKLETRVDKNVIVGSYLWPKYWIEVSPN